MEFALVLPLLLMLVVGLFEFGRIQSTKIMLDAASREGVRVLAISGDSEAAADAVVAAAVLLDGDLMSITSTVCDRGDPTSVTVEYPVAYSIPFFGSATIMLASTAVMRCEN